MKMLNLIQHPQVSLNHLALALAAGVAAFFAVSPSAVAAPAIPTPPVTDYARWFDASTLGLGDGAGVSTWPDGSVNAANATVPDGNATPAYVANAGTETGLGAIYFAGNGGASDSAALGFSEDSSIRTIFSVFKGNSFLLTDAGGYDFHRPSDDDPTSPLWAPYASGNVLGGSTYVNGTLVDGTTYNMPAGHNGFNLVEVVTTDNVRADSFNKDRVFHSGNQYQAEVIIYDRALSEDERVEVEHYLMTKWFAVTYAPEAKITGFGPGATVGQPSGGTASIAWTVPSSMTVTSLAPTFTLSSGATCNLASGSTHDFSSPVHYIVTSSDNLITNDYSVTVTVAALPVVTNLTCWFDAAQGTTTDGSGVAVWADQSGNGHTATRINGTMQVAAGAVNGLPAVQFDGNAIASMDGNQYSKTQFIVTKMNGGDWGAWMGSQSRGGYLYNPNGQCWDGNTPAAVSVNGSALAGYPYYLGDNRNSQYMVLKIVGNDNDTSQRPYELGRQEGWNSLNNYMAEIISYSGTLSEDDEDRVGGYLATKYGIATAYPPATPSAIMKRFGPTENPGVVDQTAHTVDWYVPFGTDVTSLSPTYKLVYGATCDLASGSTQDFTSPVVYTVTSSDATIVQTYTVTVHPLPNWPTLINVNYSGGANGNLNGIFSFDSVARGNAASVAPVNYAGSTWTDAVGNSQASGSNLPDSQGNSTSVGFTTNCNNGPWGDWSALGGARISHAVVADYTTYQPVLTVNGLDTGHQYDLYIASTHNDQNKPADWQVGAAVQHLENNTGESTNWVEGKNFVHFSNLIPRADGTLVVKAKGDGEYDGIDLNAFQVQDMGVRGINPEALFYEFSFGSGVGSSATTLSGTDISVNMYTGTDVSALMPTFATSAGATVTAAGTPVVSGDARNFTSPVHYLVTSEDTHTTLDYTVTVNLVPQSGHIHLNIDNAVRTGLYGPAPFSGLGKTWNQTPNAKSGSNLLDEDGVATTVGFNCDSGDGPGAWGSPSLSLLAGAVYVGDGGSRNMVISGLVAGKKYNLYVPCYWWDGGSKGAFSTTNTTTTVGTQYCDNGGAVGQNTSWVQGVNYVLFQNVEPDGSNNITVTYTGNGNYAMVNGFQLLDTGIKSPYCDMLTFGPGATITGTNIAWTVPNGTSLATLAPTFTTSGLATCTQPNGAAPTPNFSSGPVHYVVTADDGIHSTDYLVTVTVAASPLASMACWYDAGAGITQDGSGVLTWSDLSGNGHNATRGNGTVTLVPNDVNSLPAVHLRGGNTFMNCAGAFSSLVKEEYLVVRSPNANWNGSGSFLGRASNDFLTVRGSSYNMDNGTTGFWQDHFPTAVSKNGTPVPLDVPYGNGPGYRLYTITDYMILKITVDNDGVANFANYPNYQIGKNETLGTMDFDVAEIIGFDHALVTADENTVTTYLTNKYFSAGGYAGWAATYAGGQAANLDYNNDGVANGIAYFMGATGRATLPGVVNGHVAWPHDASATGITYKVLTSANLADWTDVTADAGGFLTYTLPTGDPTRFVRLEVLVP